MRRMVVLGIFLTVLAPATAGAGDGFQPQLFVSYLVIVTFALFVFIAVATTLVSTYKNDVHWKRYLGAFLASCSGGVLGFALIRPDLLVLPAGLTAPATAVYIMSLVVALIHLFRVRTDQTEVARLLLIYFLVVYVGIGYILLLALGGPGTGYEPAQPLAPTNITCHTGADPRITVTLANTGSGDVNLAGARFILQEIDNTVIYTNNSLAWTDKSFARSGGIETVTVPLADTPLEPDHLYVAWLTFADGRTVTLGDCVPG